MGGWVQSAAGRGWSRYAGGAYNKLCTPACPVRRTGTSWYGLAWQGPDRGADTCAPWRRSRRSAGWRRAPDDVPGLLVAALGSRRSSRLLSCLLLPPGPALRLLGGHAVADLQPRREWAKGVSLPQAGRCEGCWLAAVMHVCPRRRRSAAACESHARAQAASALPVGWCTSMPCSYCCRWVVSAWWQQCQPGAGAAALHTGAAAPRTRQHSLRGPRPRASAARMRRSAGRRRPPELASR